MSAPRVFRLPHLSEDAVAAFADGFLSAPAAARAERHCAACSECDAAVRGQREAAMMLRSAAAPRLPAGLLDRLAGLPMSASLPMGTPGGLRTVLGEDGQPMLLSYGADEPAVGVEPEAGSGADYDQADFRAIASRGFEPLPKAHDGHPADGRHPGRIGHSHAVRRVVPIGFIAAVASVAAVVAAGTLGAQAPALSNTDLGGTNGIQTNISGVLGNSRGDSKPAAPAPTGAVAPAAGVPAPLIGELSSVGLVHSATGLAALPSASSTASPTSLARP